MKSGFTTALNVRLKEQCDNVWIVVSPLKYWSEMMNQLIVVPPWFETKSDPTTKDDEPLFYTDFASVPRVPIVYDAWGDRAHREATLHDWLYRIDSIPVVSYSQANSIFLEAMKSTGKPLWIAYGMYWGVVLGGFSSYHKLHVKDKL